MSLLLTCEVCIIKNFQIFIITLLISTISLLSAPAHAQSIIRDTELEEAMTKWSSDIIRAAGLSPQSVNFIFIDDRQINAFVAGGQNVFLYTGLIDRTERLEELLGVVAHEVGHISGGHLIRTREAVENASYETIIGTLVGIGAALAAGNAGAASAAGAAASSVGQRSFFAHSRVQESAADQAGLTFLNQAGIDPKGLLTFFEKMEDEDLLPQTQQLEYVRTHPLNRNRMSAVIRRAQESRYFGQGVPQNWEAEYYLIKAKLLGFISPERVIWEYGDRDTSLPARYARAIASYRQNKVDDAVSKINALLNEYPQNPYFHELKGQMLVDFGRVNDALPSYRTALSLNPDAALIRIAYAHALIETSRGDATRLNEAIDQLKKANIREKRSTRLHRLMATAYGRMNDEGRASLHLAEEALLQGRKDFAQSRATLAKQKLPNGSADWFRAQDILNYLEQG
ncbi:MAG: peptidase M48 family protein [Micavibrio sp.]|nr:peptidase M48 family protein [Micavibrio sp.]